MWVLVLLLNLLGRQNFLRFLVGWMLIRGASGSRASRARRRRRSRAGHNARVVGLAAAVAHDRTIRARSRGRACLG